MSESAAVSIVPTSSSPRGVMVRVVPASETTRSKSPANWEGSEGRTVPRIDFVSSERSVPLPEAHVYSARIPASGLDDPPGLLTWYPAQADSQAADSRADRLDDRRTAEARHAPQGARAQPPARACGAAQAIAISAPGGGQGRARAQAGQRAQDEPGDVEHAQRERQVAPRDVDPVQRAVVDRVVVTVGRGTRRG